MKTFKTDKYDIIHVFFSYIYLVVDECLAFPGICNNGTCVNQVDGFHCLCPAGFVYDFTVGTCVGKFKCSV